MPPTGPVRALVITTTAMPSAREVRCRITEVLRALKAEGVYTVVLNAPLATMSKWSAHADSAYFIPVDRRAVKRVILDERVNALMLDSADQVAVGCVRELEESGFLARLGIVVFDGGAVRPAGSAGHASAFALPQARARSPGPGGRRRRISGSCLSSR